MPPGVPPSRSLGSCAPWTTGRQGRATSRIELCRGWHGWVDATAIEPPRDRYNLREKHFAGCHGRVTNRYTVLYWKMPGGGELAVGLRIIW